MGTKKDRTYGAGESAVSVRTGGGMRAFYALLVVVAVVGAGAVFFAVRSKRAEGIAGATGPVAIPDASDPTRLMALARGMMKGDSAAPVTIIEFADFECPYCGTFAREVEPQIHEEFIANGRAKFVFYDFPLVRSHEHAFLAARAARCAEDQGKFWEYHDALYKNQSRWASAKDPSAAFQGFAADLGLDASAFVSCLASDRHADLVTANMELGKQMQVDRTPTVLVTQGRGSGQKVTPTIDDIRAAMEEIAAEPR